MPTINITGKPNIGEENSVKVNIEDPVNIKIRDPDRQIFEFKLNMRRALNGDYMIFDHADIDIVIQPKQSKVVAFAKDIMSEVVYGAENRLFEHLKKKGIIQYDSIQGGNVYGSLEGVVLKIVEGEKLDSLDYLLFEVSRWMDTERPYFESVKAHDEMMDDALLEPEDKYSTELGEVPHEEEKGSIRQHGLFAPYMYGRYIY